MTLLYLSKGIEIRVVVLILRLSALSIHHDRLYSALSPPWTLKKRCNHDTVHRKYLELFTPKLLTAEQSPILNGEARQDLVVHAPYFLLALWLCCCCFCPVQCLVIRMISGTGYVQCDDYIRALLY